MLSVASGASLSVSKWRFFVLVNFFCRCCRISARIGVVLLVDAFCCFWSIFVCFKMEIFCASKLLLPLLQDYRKYWRGSTSGCFLLLLEHLCLFQNGDFLW